MYILYWILISILALSAMASAQEREVDIYGFMDLEYEYDNAGDKSTFDIHHFNIINTYSFEQFRIFSEMEWEHGPKIEPQEGEGEITLERAWFEYLYNDRLKIRAGKFLTPLGIYNLIHDSTPLFLTTSLPLMYGSHNPFGGKKDRLFAKFYTGLQVSGSHVSAADLRWTYALGIGNGRGRAQFSADNDHHKATILRLRVAHPKGLQVGASHYRDRNEQGVSGKARAREQLYGMDLEVDKGALLLQSEYALFRLERDGADAGFQNASAYYGLLAYRIGDFVTPVVRFDQFDPDGDSSGDANKQWLLGVNVALDPRIYLKSEIQFRSSDVPTTDSDWFHLSSISVAF